MKNLLAALVVAALALGSGFAQVSNRVGDTAAAPAKEQKPRQRPFYGRIKTVTASAIVMQGPKAQTFQVTPASKILKDDQPVRVGDLKSGDLAGGSVREMADGKWELVTLKINTKAPKAPPTKPK